MFSNTSVFPSISNLRRPFSYKVFSFSITWALKSFHELAQSHIRIRVSTYPFQPNPPNARAACFRISGRGHLHKAASTWEAPLRAIASLIAFREPAKLAKRAAKNSNKKSTSVPSRVNA